ncbi:hypothetical protein CATYP_06330 [Corynebacterium atypicum]|uniref:Thioredoxin domain-containing protein n=1 Tax=Corynebacterium atypicum TaxID=191610 RepID=A0ABM5QNB2_9CORY|nr:tetratricopeptide repeat protein [Corynebacterium atypicum]AIG64286.1 hypothetical protein CATYP_06330 [Corynebacterium atypicum]
MSVADRFSSRAVDLGRVAEAAQARKQDAAGVAAFVEVTAETAETEMIRRSVQVPVVVLVGTPRSADSEQLKADLKELAEGYQPPRFVVAYLDADAQPQLAQALGVQGLPTVLALAAGRPVASFEGGQPKAQLEAWTAALVQQVGPQLEGLPAHGGEQAEVDPRLADAAIKLDQQDFSGALEIYDAMLQEKRDPEVLQARGLALVLQRLAADGDDEPDVFVQADKAIVAGRPEEAFEVLLDAMRAATGAKKTAVKDRLISLFEVYGNSDPRVREARTAMASALF